MALYKIVNGERIAMTDAETTAREAEEKAWSDGEKDRNLEFIRSIRLGMLQETDFYGMSDVTMSDDMKTYRQELRDITNGLTTVEDVEAVVFPTKP